MEVKFTVNKGTTFWEFKKCRFNRVGLEITAGQRTMSELIWELTGQPFDVPVMLTGHI